jgi:hypothetical protein
MTQAPAPEQPPATTATLPILMHHSMLPRVGGA